MARLEYFSEDSEEDDTENTDIEISPKIIEIICKAASLDEFIISANEWVKENNATVFNDIIDYNDKTKSFEKFCSFLELNKKQIMALQDACNDFYYSYPEHKKIPVKFIDTSKPSP